MLKTGTFLWSNNWWLEDNKAYLCSGGYGALFCVDMFKQQCNLVARIPDSKFKSSRSSAYCRKYKNKVFCAPYEEKFVCFYDLKKNIWKKINVGFKTCPIINMNSILQNDTIWLMELLGKNIYKINLDKEIVVKKFNICQDDDVFTGQYILVENCIYCIAGKKINSIDIQSGEITIFELSKLNMELYTICFDGNNFWLSGCEERIYIWNPQEGIIKEIKKFIENSNINSNLVVKNIPLFTASIFLGGFVWFIPLQCNAPIMYVNKENYELGVLEIEEEQETEESLMKRGNAFKYMFEYIRENRYIGVYSSKNQIVFEIDTAVRCVKNREIVFGDDTIYAIAHEIYSDTGLLAEKKEESREIFLTLLNKEVEAGKTRFSNVGKLIYNSTKNKF